MLTLFLSNFKSGFKTNLLFIPSLKFDREYQITRGNFFNSSRRNIRMHQINILKNTIFSPKISHSKMIFFNSSGKNNHMQDKYLEKYNIQSQNLTFYGGILINSSRKNNRMQQQNILENTIFIFSPKISHSMGTFFNSSSRKNKMQQINILNIWS